MRAWVNGRPGTLVDLRDRGLNYGDGVFETMRVHRRGIRLLDYHLERLEEGCRRLGLPAQDPGRLRNELIRLAAQRSDGVVKLIVTRGVGRRGYGPSGRERGMRAMSIHGLSRAAIRATREPVGICLCTMRLGTNQRLAGLKTLNRLESVLARAEWTDPRIWEGLMRDTDDNLVCGTMSNLFVRRGSSLMTPLLDRCGIAGVMRRWVLEQAAALALRATEGRVRWEDLAGAEEVFMTNAVAGIVPVALIRDGRTRLRLPQRHAAQALRLRLESL